MNEPRRVIQDDHEKIIVLGFSDRHARADSELIDDLRQSVGMPNHEHISPERFQLCDQRPEIVTLDDFRSNA